MRWVTELRHGARCSWARWAASRRRYEGVAGDGGDGSAAGEDVGPIAFEEAAVIDALVFGVTSLELG